MRAFKAIKIKYYCIKSTNPVARSRIVGALLKKGYKLIYSRATYREVNNGEYIVARTKADPFARGRIDLFGGISILPLPELKRVLNVRDIPAYK